MKYYSKAGRRGRVSLFSEPDFNDENTAFACILSRKDGRIFSSLPLLLRSLSSEGGEV